MTNSHPIERDVFYKRLSVLVSLSDLNPVEKVLFLSVFESWHYFQSYELYSSIASKAIEVFEDMENA
ncbi:hypothetical protein [Vibrio vulnificus]|uniref:hypothetical protein n=1 Tax=Vibrio vulnificus TaxID=672 RepID=UPI001CDCD004|nr:hypothetical protein [Vibrio vulnificus]MCA4024239.1 hypothetical protein [Vibrio vulnificus]